MITRNTMSDLERAIYDLAEAGLLDATRARLYTRPVGKLLRAVPPLLRPKAGGGYEAVRTDTMAPPAPEEMVTVSVRVPAHVAAALEGMGPTKSEAARAILGRALGSGTMRKAVGV
jgi:hypothetical protein